MTRQATGAPEKARCHGEVYKLKSNKKHSKTTANKKLLMGGIHRLLADLSCNECLCAFTKAHYWNG